MTQEEQKKLLLKDLCSRLPYGVKASTKVGGNIKISFIGEDTIIGEDGDSYDISFITPYLFPITTLTDEQLEEFYCNFVENEISFNDFKKYYYETTSYFELLTRVSDCPYVVDWFNKNHLDYRGLIPMGLAVDATGKNVY